MKSTIFFAIVALTGCAAQGEDAKPARETYTNALLRVDTSIKGLAETQGNTNAELEAIREELKAVKQEVSDLSAGVESLNKLLTASEAPEAPVLQIRVPDPPAVKADAAPIENAERRTVTLNGKPLDVAAVIKTNYKRRWSHPGTIDSHLTEHGVAGFASLDNETKERLHSALHEMGQAPAKAVAKERTVYRAPVSVQSCPNGQCPNVQYGYSRSRSRLFGWRR